MSCYFRHIKDIFEAAGIEVSKENKKILDEAIHRFVHVEYKNCSPTWKAIKDQVRDDKAARQRLIRQLERLAHK